MIYLVPLLSVLLGYAVALILKPSNKKSLKLLLAFSGAFLLSLTVLHLLPEVYESSNHVAETHVEETHNHEAHAEEAHNHDGHEHGHEAHNHQAHEGHDPENHDHDAHIEDDGHGHDHKHANNPIGLYIMAGIVFQIILEYFSKGAEHGHVHGGHDHDHGHSSMPWLLFISLCIHALLEGMPVHHYNELAWGIAIHHFPIAIILTAFFINSGLNKIAVLLFMVAFSAMTPLGTLASGQLDFLADYFTEISAVVVGILFHISSTIIFESGENHRFNLAKLLAIILGAVMAYFL
jgi:zinc transporter ZupT